MSQVSGLSVEALGPDALVGEVCEIAPRGEGKPVRAEVVGLRQGKVVLMPYANLQGVGIGCEVVAIGALQRYPVGPAVLGRVLDAFGEPLDGKPAPVTRGFRSLRSPPINPMQRPAVRRCSRQTCARSYALLGRGQRVGIFRQAWAEHAARHDRARVTADVNVIALAGESAGVKFVEAPGTRRLARSWWSHSDHRRRSLARARPTPPPRSPVLATRGATCSSRWIRYALRHGAARIGERPLARLPHLGIREAPGCASCAPAPSGGSITALYTVLVEGGNFSEPISDILRATLDGHILRRAASRTRPHPAIDILQSTSRLFADLSSAEDRALAATVTESLALYERNRQMVDIGAYKAGANPNLDRVLESMPALERVLRQDASQAVKRAEAIAALRAATRRKGAA